MSIFLVPLPQIVARSLDSDTGDPLPEVSTEVAKVARDQVRRASFDSGEKNRRVFFGQVDACGKRRRSRVEEFEALSELRKPRALSLVIKVDSRLADGESRRAKRDIVEPPQPQDAGAGKIRGREQHVGVEEERSIGYFGRRCGMLSGSTPSFFASRRARR